MKYAGCLFAVKDIQIARKFYEELFDLKVIVDYGKNIVFESGLSLQQDFDWLTGISKEDMKDKENNCEIFFEAESFEEFLSKLNARNDVTLLRDVEEAPWGQKVVRIYDLDNHLIEIGESMKSVVNRFQEQGMNLTEVAMRMDITIDDVNQILQG
ncbi:MULTISPECIES: VOC family protein [unclassified Clostridioides]|uniref:VOC family protein n=1 Tax=unclassified Clostridioides TaxID=2635829 RepID=UPI001D0F81D5|nr:glyoxalase [Clostridioides sp. ES-S-0049-03]MCC0678093.1 glyoxalase [Clostridioides sp. ES-W-0018-02]MCC0712603.1 glyoxalase [Clostridioides sp. ES-W-0017-02]